MQLLTSPLSPFGTRVELQIALKSLPVEAGPPPVPLRTPEFFQRYPLGRVPILVTPDGELNESLAIMEYLEDRFPDPALRPADPWALAQLRARCRFMDIYLGPALTPLFFAVFQGAETMPPGDEVHRQVALLEGFWSTRPETGLCLDDLALAPTWYFFEAIMERAGQPLDPATHPTVSRWWSDMQDHAVVGPGIAAMAAAFEGVLASA